MKKILFLLIIVLCASCNREVKQDLEPTPDVPFGDFSGAAYGLDTSSSNKFNESQFLYHWAVAKVTIQTYIDGEYVSSEDATSYIGTNDEYTFREDHTMFPGWKWIYTHNCILWKTIYGGYYGYEVVDVHPGVLIWKKEEFPDGGPITPYVKDPKGEHVFYIYELHSVGVE
jgi:hypothetical protein